MRYMTPDTPTRSLESQETKTQTQTKTQEKQETSTNIVTMATVTSTPTPKQSPEKTAAHATATATATAQPAQKRRRAIRTYGSKKRTLDEAADSRAKRRRPSVSTDPTAPTASASIASAADSAPRRPSTCEGLVDEVSRQLQTEAAEAARRCEEKENRTAPKPQKRQPQASQAPPRPKTPRTSPRKALGIMRYFQPAAAPRARSPPPALQVACSPTASISSMSSLSSCPSPSPTSPTSASSIYQEDVDEAVKDGDSVQHAATDPVSPMVWRDQPRRPKRRLTIRPEHVRADADGSDAQSESEDNDGNDGNDEALASTPLFKAFNGMSSSSRMRVQLGLAQEAAPTSSASNPASTRAKAKTVQTTLSLAIGPSDSGSVRECKECNILYNPLHDKDAKFHARYHASVVGRGRKRVV